jgi:MFS family permease
MIVVQTVLIVISGRLVAKIGRYKPLIVCGPPLIALGCGLLYWANMTTHPSYFLGFQVLLGVGVALFLQNVMWVPSRLSTFRGT